MRQPSELGDHHHPEDPLGASHGLEYWPDNESGMGRLDAQYGLFLVFPCQSFLLLRKDDGVQVEVHKC